MKSISPKEFFQLLQTGADIQLIDVREKVEHQEFNIGGILIPLSDITKQIDLIEKEKPVVIYCRKGVRSQIAIQRLLQKFPFQNLINLEGGTEKWKEDVAS